MERPSLLIAIPLKSELHYQARKEKCLETWLKDSPVDYKFFTDADLGLNPKHHTVRQMRTKLMVKYAYDHEYDFVLRSDADSYVWIDRLLHSGFENHDYTGYCVDYPPSNAFSRTAHGCGFILSRKAMEIVIAAPCARCKDDRYWGDIWTGEVLFKNGIYCNRDTRFYPDKDKWENQDLSEAILIHPVIEGDE